MLWFKKKKKTSVKDIKYANTNIKSTSFYKYLVDQGSNRLAINQAFSYYDEVAPLSTAIDWISNEAININPVIFDKKKKEFITDHPILDLLNNPNPYDSRINFLTEIYKTYLLTGNVFIVSHGLTKPYFLSSENPENVTIYSGSNGYPNSFVINSNNKSEKFSIKNDGTDGETAIYADDAGIKQIYHIRSYNPTRGNNNFFGISPISSIYYDVEQYTQLSIHNLSVLKRGGRLSGVLITKSNLSDEQFTNLESSLNNYMGGSENAGRLALIEGAEMEYKELGKSARDMDFLNLRNSISETIYKRFRIPLPLINQDKATYSNMDVSKLSLYDNVVLPFVSMFFYELTRFLMSKYDNSENLIITYDESTITALETRRLDQAKTMTEIGALTINEIRSDLSYENLDGGDDLYLNSSLVPVASEEMKDDKE